MSITSPFFYCVATVLNSLVLPQYATAVPNVKDRLILAFNPTTDYCIQLHAFSDTEEKNAADLACDMAFRALDQTNGNYCPRCRKAGCRSLPGLLYRQCTCKISMCSPLDLRIDLTRSFRECALDLFNEETEKKRLIPSQRFEEAFIKIQCEAWQKAWEARAVRSFRNWLDAGGADSVGTLHDANTSYGEVPGTSNVPDTSHGEMASTSYVPETSYGEMASASYLPHTSYGEKASTSYLPHTSYGGGPSTSYIPHTSYGEMPGTSYAINTDHGLLTQLGSNDGETPYVAGNSFGGDIQSGSSSRPDTRATSSSISMSAGRKSGKVIKGVGDKSGSVTKGAGGKMFVCDECGHEYKTGRGLFDHKKIHQEDLQCHICKRNFLAKASYDIHVKKRHPGFEAAARGEGSANVPAVVEDYNASRPFACAKCGKRFVRKDGMRQHMKSHNKGAAFCTICDKNLSTPYGYRSHMKSQHGIEIPADEPKKPSVRRNPY